MTKALGSIIALLMLTTCARADFLLYRVPGLGYSLILEGEVRRNVGLARTLTLNHKLGKLHLNNTDVGKLYDVEPMPALFTRKLAKAGDAQEAMGAARWALKLGLLKQFYIAIDKALEFDPQYADARRVIKLKEQFSQDFGMADLAAREKEMRKVVRNPKMKIAHREHFILLHDTSDKPPEGYGVNAKKQKTRSESRLDLLEKVYEAFLMKFYSQGVELEVPKERLKVVLFNDQQDYLQFARSISPSLSSAIGFYDPASNMSFFYDHGSSEKFQELRKLSSELQEKRAEYVKSKQADLVRLCDTISLLFAIDQENSDIEVVSHEATHQMASNTGLFPRDVLVPKWVHEGLATYFEAPSEASWSGMGAVNTGRLNDYKMFQQVPKYSSIDYVVGDQLFYTRSNMVTSLGYAQGWALTHFLVDRHFEELMTFYRRLGELPPDMVYSPELLIKVFDRSFKTPREALDEEWRQYMSRLKTDFERITGESDAGPDFR
jgi:hypothetical protein